VVLDFHNRRLDRMSLLLSPSQANMVQTVVVGIGAYFLLPNTIGTASFLKEDERIFAVTRLRHDVPARLTQDGR
jgi:hypothetical protein